MKTNRRKFFVTSLGLSLLPLIPVTTETVSIDRIPLNHDGYTFYMKDEPNHKYIYVNSKLPENEQNQIIEKLRMVEKGCFRCILTKKTGGEK